MMIGALAMTLLSACADNNLETDIERENQSFQNKIRKKIQIYMKMS